jgi:hypothetical protein
VGELLEVELLCGDQWAHFEERHHSIQQLATPLHTEAEQRVAMIAWPRLLHDRAAPKHLDEALERSAGRSGLRDGELVLDLPAEPTRGIPNHADRKASFTVDEADGPLLGSWPFLLIVRTGRIVTIHASDPRKGV